MRYQEHASPEDRPAGVDSGMMAGTAGYTLLLGLAFVFFGLRGRQRWIAFWGVTMVVAGAVYLIALMLGAD